MEITQRLVFDVGMHKGQDTDFYLRKGFNVVAFEADPALVAQCKSRFRGAIAGGQLRIVEGAVAPPSFGDRVLLRTNSLSIWNTIDEEWAARRRANGEIDVQRVDIEDAFSRYGMPYYLKVDIEGMDTYVVQSLQSFNVKPPHVSFESDKRDFVRVQAEVELLRTLGYRRFRAVQQAWIHKSTLSTRTLDGQPFDYGFESGASGPFSDDVQLPWSSDSAVLDKYQEIFKRYRRLGDESFIGSIRGSGRAIELVSRVIGRQVLGWYDTHAAL